MNLTAEDITSQILTLSEPDQQKVIDFIESLKSELSQQPLAENEEVMTHFRAGMQKNHHLGKLLA